MIKNRVTAKQTHYEISDYDIGDKPYIEKMLSVWDKNRYELKPIAIDYVPETRTLLIPRGVDSNTIARNFGNITVDTNYDKSSPVIFKLLSEPKDDNQKKYISFLSGMGDFSYTKSASQLILTADTGDGKTYSTIAALSFLRVKTLIITPSTGIQGQWIDSFQKFTNIDTTSICVLTGSSKIDKVIKENRPYKVYFMNYGTIVAYTKKYGWGKFGETISKLGIGLKVFDEAHLWMDKLLKVDMHTNVKKTFYLTATFKRTTVQEKELFNKVFQQVPRFGMSTRVEKCRHIVCVRVHFNSKPTIDDLAKCKTRNGFNKNWYSDYITNKKILTDVLQYVDTFLSKIDGKKLVLSTKIDSSDTISWYYKNTYPDLKVCTYNSTTPDDIKNNLTDYDIVSSTPKSAGTGFDLPGLSKLIIVEPYSSEIAADQIPGRLRANPDFPQTFYVELVDTGFKDIKRMTKAHEKVLKQKCLKIIDLDYKPEYS